VTDMY